MRKDTQRPRRHWKALLTIGLWSAFAAFYTAQSYYYRKSAGQPITLWGLLPRELFYVGLWGLSTPLILWLARRFPVDRRNWPTRVPMHVAFAFVLAVAQRAIYDATVMSIAAGGLGAVDLNALRRSILGTFDYGMFLYVIVLLIGLAIGYYERFREEADRAVRLRADLADARLTTLQMQLQPHFLFNTLNAIAVLIRTDPDAASTMVGRLGDFLRVTLESRDVRLVSLQREVEFLDSYLEIERVRFGPRLQVEKEIDPVALGARVPLLILQPIVENAVRHGIGRVPGPGTIRIRGWVEGEFVVLEVRNTGSPDGSGGEAPSGTGIGLANTRARLEELYGARQEARLESLPDGGTVVTVRLPREGGDAMGSEAMA